MFVHCYSHVSDNLSERSIPSDNVAVRIVVQKPMGLYDTVKRIASWMTEHPVFCNVLMQMSDGHQYPDEPFAVRSHFGSSRDPSPRLEFPLHLPSRQPHQDSFRVRFFVCCVHRMAPVACRPTTSVGNLVVPDRVRSLWWNMDTKLGGSQLRAEPVGRLYRGRTSHWQISFPSRVIRRKETSVGTSKRQFLPLQNRIEKQKNYLERISSEIETKQQHRLEILQKWIEADQELDAAHAKQVQAKHEMSILVAEQTAENAKAVNQGTSGIQSFSSPSNPDPDAQQTILSVFKSVLSMQNMGCHSVAEQLMAAGATDEEVKKISQNHGTNSAETGGWK